MAGHLYRGAFGATLLVAAFNIAPTITADVSPDSLVSVAKGKIVRQSRHF
jgi:hypothetical protein